MQTVFSQRLLAGLQARTSEEEDREDAEDRIDPDDPGPRLSVTLKEPFAEICALTAARAEQTSGRCSDTSDQSKAPQSSLGASAATAGTPAPPDLLHPAVLRTMPPKVAAFMLYEPPDPPIMATAGNANSARAQSAARRLRVVGR